MGQLEDMEIFTEIVRAGGITHAADRLNIAPSAVSRRLKDIEARLGVQLMNRTTRQMALTETGRAYLAHAERILSDVEEANNEITRASGELSGAIRIAAPLSFGLSHLAGDLSDFMRKHPQITLDIDLSDRRVDLVQEGYDLAIRIGNLPDSSLRGRKITGIKTVLVASPDFIDRYGPLSSPADLDGLPGFVYTGDASAGNWSCRSPSGEDFRFRIKPSMLCNNGDLMREASTRGLGLLKVPSFIVEDSLRFGSLISLFSDHDWGSVGLHILWPPTRHLSARTRALIDHLADTLARNCQTGPAAKSRPGKSKGGSRAIG
ncbi:LysR family transcriptional regulator [Aquisalinus flavus]|uniref:LysR family transcriptional regulator n=1 Tax=Aquisalinus flavus TaxID=1526572 RepID=A0A8J2Y6D5_9PROT|nr:LysR family transcriptional regulator [Aquisalinus flavus]MBD0426354.1 LysR family transcriptional regulator [Aquisalinus flavus]UNE48080.1 LysR family transcriptional regulator [Aquisalinus flavus]GGD08642.1 LysR family transcriptional regulator [Aquisalinus flavus]